MSFGSRQVLTGVDLRLEAGMILGLLGVNGSGKTTLINVATGLLKPQSGRASIYGHDIQTQRLEAAKRFGFAPQRLAIYPDLDVENNLAIAADLAGVSRRRRRSRTAEVVEMLGLTDVGPIPAAQLSGGQQRRLHTAMALLARPPLLFLDEPTVGADVTSRAHILNTVRGLADAGTAVLYTSHIMEEFEQLGANIAVLHGGRVTSYGTAADLMAAHASAQVSLRFVDPSAPHALLPHWESGSPGELTLRCDEPGRALSQAVQALGEHARLIEDVAVSQPSLEQAFLAVTSPFPPERLSQGHVARGPEK